MNGPQIWTALDPLPHVTTAVTLLLALCSAPVVAACIVLTWHGLRGTDPGPAGTLLLQLTRTILRFGRDTPSPPPQPQQAEDGDVDPASSQSRSESSTEVTKTRPVALGVMPARTVSHSNRTVSHSKQTRPGRLTGRGTAWLSWDKVPVVVDLAHADG